MSLRAPTILMVSKPLALPFNDATKNLVRDIVGAVPERRFHVLSRGDFHLGLAHVREERIARADPGWRPPYWQEVSTFLRLIKPDGCGVHHYFFTPTLLSARMVALAIALKTRQPTLQTLCSAPPTHLPLAKLPLRRHRHHHQRAHSAAHSGRGGLAMSAPFCPPWLSPRPCRARRNA